MGTPPSDRIRVFKSEDSSTGGQAVQRRPFPVAINRNEDALDGRGIFFQDASSNDELVVIFREAGEMHFLDPAVGTSKTLAQLAATDDATAIRTKLLTVDGTGSGLDADLLDGQHGAYYRDASNLNVGTLSPTRLPIATASLLGGIKVGANLSIDPITGVLSATASSTVVAPVKDTGGTDRFLAPDAGNVTIVSEGTSGNAFDLQASASFPSSGSAFLMRLLRGATAIFRVWASGDVDTPGAIEAADFRLNTSGAPYKQFIRLAFSWDGGAGTYVLDEVVDREGLYSGFTHNPTGNLVISLTGLWTDKFHAGITCHRSVANGKAAIGYVIYQDGTVLDIQFFDVDLGATDEVEKVTIYIEFSQ